MNKLASSEYEVLGDTITSKKKQKRSYWKQIEESAAFCFEYKQPSPQRSSESEIDKLFMIKVLKIKVEMMMKMRKNLK